MRDRMKTSPSTAGGKENMPTSGAELQDRFVLWPLGIGLAMLTVFGSLYGFLFPLAGLMFVFMLVTLLIAAVVGLVLAFTSAWRRQWRRATSAIALSAYITAMSIYPGTFLRPFTFVGVWAHFLCVYNIYQAEVMATPQDKGPRMARFLQGTFAMFELYVVYDEADHLASLSHRGVGECNNDLSHLRGHYYACLESEL